MRLSGGTLFSGIGAPEAACAAIDWRWCAEIDPFASAVHRARFPGIPNLGDVERIDADAVEPVDVVVFGSPCQSFSVAGKRLGLDDPRGNLALVALRLVERLRPRWFLFENVPGLLSSDEGRDFGTFLGAVEQCGYGWAYRTLDAQYFGVPQRRRRLFVVGHLGDWRPAAAVLFEPESLHGNPAPGRKAGEGVAPILEVGARTGVSTDDPRAGIGIGELGDPMFTLQSGKHHGIADVAPSLSSRATAGGGLGTDFECDGGLIAQVAPTLSVGAHGYGIGSDALDRSGEGAAGNAAERSGLNIVEGCQPSLRARANNAVAYGGNRQSGPIEAVNAHGGPHGRQDFETETFIACGRSGDLAPTLQAAVGGNGNAGNGSEMIVTHALRAEGFDASEDGTGRGTPLVAIIPIQGTLDRNKKQNGLGIGEVGDPQFTLTGRDQHAIAFDARQSDVCIYGDQANVLDTDGHTQAIAFQSNYSNQAIKGDRPTLTANRATAVAFNLRGREGGSMPELDEIANIRSASGGSSRSYVQQMAVRRLTPVECEKLQGFPPGWTAISYRGKPAADGPRYRALGNSMAVPVIRWILERIMGAA
jgi:DNA (cytosine-5)-methyltransferase 1